MPNKEITTDFADGFRAGFDAARAELEIVVMKAVSEGRSVMKAMRAVQVPAPARQEDPQ
jgi:hypothetical protein